MKKFKQEIVEVGDTLIIDGVNYKVDACINGENMEIFMVNLSTGRRTTRHLKNYKFDKLKESDFKKAA